MHSTKPLRLFVLFLSAVLGCTTKTTNSTNADTTNTVKSCSPATFTFPSTQLSSISILDISAASVINYTATSLAPGTNTGGRVTISFCNVTFTYTHPGWNDTIHTTVQLPSAGWNGKLQAVGGGGYSASFGELYTAQAVDKGYVSVDTDAGHVKGSDVSTTPSTWALTSPGNVNLALVEDWGSVSLHEMAVLGKAATEAFYSTAPKYSYFAGCSGGGRQGLMIAEKYGDDFDGILAVAPAINIENLIPAGYWANQVMTDLDYYPPACEVEAFTQAAVDACDLLDGLEDGIISRPELCDFDPHTVVGQSVNCSGVLRDLTSKGAAIVEAAWTGPRADGDNLGWFGINKDADLTSYYAATTCTTNSTCSVGSSASLFSSWITYFLAKDPEFDASAMTDAEFFAYLNQSQVDYDQPLAAANPDLSGFRAAGGKMIVWQGLADEAIPPNGTAAFYQQVVAQDASAGSFFRFFQAPGVGHCIGGSGPIPNSALDQLVSWVEEDVFPETLTAVDTSGNTRELCNWPLQQVYIGGNTTDPASFDCAEVDYPDLAAEFPFFTG